MKFNCPECNSAYAIKDEVLFRPVMKATCEKCGTKMSIERNSRHVNAISESTTSSSKGPNPLADDHKTEITSHLISQIKNKDYKSIPKKNMDSVLSLSPKPTKKRDVIIFSCVTLILIAFLSGGYLLGRHIELLLKNGDNKTGFKLTRLKEMIESDKKFPDKSKGTLSTKENKKIPLRSQETMEELRQAIRATAKPVTFAFNGIVTSLGRNTRKLHVTEYFSEGDTFSGVYTFDSLAKASQYSDKNSHGWYYPFFKNPGSMILVFDKDPVNLMFKLKVPTTSPGCIYTKINSERNNKYMLSVALEGKQPSSSNVCKFEWHSYCSMPDISLPRQPPPIEKNEGYLIFFNTDDYKKFESGPVKSLRPSGNIKFKITSISLDQL